MTRRGVAATVAVVLTAYGGQHGRHHCSPARASSTHRGCRSRTRSATRLIVRRWLGSSAGGARRGSRDRAAPRRNAPPSAPDGSRRGGRSPLRRALRVGVRGNRGRGAGHRRLQSGRHGVRSRRGVRAVPTHSSRGRGERDRGTVVCSRPGGDRRLASRVLVLRRAPSRLRRRHDDLAFRRCILPAPKPAPGTRCSGLTRPTRVRARA